MLKLKAIGRREGKKGRETEKDAPRRGSGEKGGGEFSLSLLAFCLLS